MLAETMSSLSYLGCETHSGEMNGSIFEDRLRPDLTGPQRPE